MLWKRLAVFVSCVIFIGLYVSYLTRKAGSNDDDPHRAMNDAGWNHPPTVNRETASDILDCQVFNLFDLRYCDPSVQNRSSAIGKSFNLPPTMLTKLGIPVKDFAPLERKRLEDFVFATGADASYFYPAMDAIGNVQRFLPNYTIYFYDLSEERSPESVRKIQNLCHVIYRKFNFSRYPPHIRFLKNYAFKPLIVHEMLMEFPGVFWIDSSVRFHTENLTSVLDQVYENRGILAFIRSHHSNFAATHPGMYNFLPISAAAARTTEQRDANSIFFYRTEEVYRRIIVWWVLCALKEDCMAAGRQLACNFKGKDVWAGCHRFDQSAINILMARHFQQDDLKYLSRDSVLTVQRGSSDREHLVVCPSRSRTKADKYFS